MSPNRPIPDFTGIGVEKVGQPQKLPTVAVRIPLMDSSSTKDSPITLPRDVIVSPAESRCLCTIFRVDIKSAKIRSLQQTA